VAVVRATLRVLATVVVVAGGPACRSVEQQSPEVPGGSSGASAYAQFRSPVPNVTEAMLYPEFWIKNLHESGERGGLIATGEQIRDFNRKNALRAESIVDLREYPARFGRAQLTERIQKLSKPHAGPRFKDGQRVDADYFARLTTNLGIEALPEISEARYGLVVQRSSMRNFPTDDRVFDESDGYELDRFMETTAYVGEPIVVLAGSADKQWLLGQIGNYLAWIKAEAVAFAPKEAVFGYTDGNGFLVVTGKEVRTNFDPLDAKLSEVPLFMGMRIPLASAAEVPATIDGQPPNGNYVIKLPVRTEGGGLQIKLALLSRSADVSVGYLPMTRENIIRQAFKLQGTRYGWGGSFHGVDCSSMIMEVYKTFGLSLPRNSGDLANKTVGQAYPLPEGASLDERARILDQAKVGATLWLPGHIMLYLGKYGGDHFVIHAFTGFGRMKESGEEEVVRQEQVAVTPLSILVKDKPKTFLEQVKVIRQLDPN
jgi:cell wall-associated NlpC family hydrolase